jgi:hypothetical protein
VFLRSGASITNLVTDDNRSPAAVCVWFTYNSSRLVQLKVGSAHGIMIMVRGCSNKV